MGFAEVCGAVVAQRPGQPSARPAGREALYALRDQSGLAPEQFYLTYFEPDRVAEERGLRSCLLYTTHL